LKAALAKALSYGQSFLLKERLILNVSRDRTGSDQLVIVNRFHEISDKNQH
jgi:hypothetical protein